MNPDWDSSQKGWIRIRIQDKRSGFGFGFGFEVPGFAHHCSGPNNPCSITSASLTAILDCAKFNKYHSKHSISHVNNYITGGTHSNTTPPPHAICALATDNNGCQILLNLSATAKKEDRNTGLLNITLISLSPKPWLSV